MLEHALSYARRGIRIIPVYWPSRLNRTGCGCCNEHCTSPAKHPCIFGWREKATCDPDTIRNWWRHWPNANIAIATGSGIVVVDIDDPSTVRKSRLRTRLASTGRGLHAYYRTDRTVRNGVRVRPGVDIRGEGGYVVAPPSVHASGTVYQWIDDRPMAPAPDWLWPLVSKAESRPPSALPGGGGYRKAFDPGLVDLIPKGGRNNALFKMACAASGKKPVQDVEAEIHWINENRCSPPLPKREVDQLLRSAMNLRTLGNIEVEG